MTELVKYDAALRMVAEAIAVDEVLDIRNKTEAMRQYARQAKNRDGEIQWAQIRFRAERRLGELIKAQKETVGLSRGGRPRLETTCSDAEQVSAPTLEQAGIDRKLSSRAQRMAEIEPVRFEQLLELHRVEVLEENNKVSVDLLRTSSEAEGRDKRRRLAQALSDSAAELPSGRLFPCAYIDPPWLRKQGVTDRSYENHYPTMAWPEIIALMERVAPLLLPDAWVFLWVPRAHMFALHPVDMDFADDDGRVITRKVKLPLAWAVARACGCDSYSTAFVWTKTDEEHPDDQGGGVLVFDQDEILLMFKRGRGLPKPATDEKFKSNHRERKREHSRKPDHYRDMIRTMTGGVPVLELFARVDADHPLPPDWQAWGNQAAPIEISIADHVEVEPAPPAAGVQLDAVAGPPALQAVASAPDGIVDQALDIASEPGDAVPPAERPGSNYVVHDDDRLAQDDWAALSSIDAGESFADGEILDRLRGQKQISGKTKPKLTKAGRQRLDVLVEHFARKDKLTELPTTLEQLVELYGLALHRFHSCVLGNDEATAAEALEQLELLQERANGNTTFGMACNDSLAERLRVENAAPIGAVPMWRQRGVFRLVIEGAPHLLEHDEDGHLSVYAEDPNRLFLSETGFRSFLGSPAFGHTVAEQAEAYIREYIAAEDGAEGKRKPRKKSLSLPQVVYRLPTAADGELEPVRVAGSIFPKKPKAERAAPAPVAPQTRLPLDNDEIELQRGLCSIGLGETITEQTARVLVGLGYAEAQGDALRVTSVGTAWLVQLVDLPPAPRNDAAPLLLDDDDFERQRGLLAIDAGETIDSAIVRDLIGIGYAHATTTRISVTEDGRAWLAQLGDLPPLNVPQFLEARA